MIFVIFLLVLLGKGKKLVQEKKGYKSVNFYALQNFYRLSSVIVIIMSSLFRVI